MRNTFRTLKEHSNDDRYLSLGGYDLFLMYFLEGGQRDMEIKTEG